MSETPDRTSSLDARPIVFDASGSTCFGWFHPARNARRGAGVVLCSAMGWEAICSYRTYIQLARALSEQGFDVVRFDYPGTGESAGNHEQPARVRAWLDGIAAATEQVRALAGVTRVGLMGLRLGATLAAEAAQRIGDVDALVMWAAAATGRAYARELRAGAQRNPNPASTDLVALGALYTAETVRDLQALDLEKAEAAPAPHVLIIGRDDIPLEGPLPAKYRSHGADAQYVEWPGYAAIIEEPHKAHLDPLIVGRITQWLCDALPAAPVAVAAAAAPEPGVEFVADGVRERSLWFGPGHALFGMLAESLAAPAQQQETGVILINVGGTYRVGPNRIYVALSRGLSAAGYRTLRFDLPGFGDSRTNAALSANSVFNRHSTAEVSAAVDLMQSRGCKRICVLGICSGSFVAFHTAQVDPRVSGQILMNSRLLEWNEANASAWESTMTKAAFKSTTYYRRALLNPEVYARLVRGKVDVRGIAARIATIAGARLRRGLAHLLGRKPVEGVLAKMRQLGARGVDTLMVLSAQDDALDYVEFHLGTGASLMHGDPNFRFVLVQEADHTFSQPASQRKAIQVLRDHLDSKLHPAEAPRTAITGAVATT